MNADGFGMELLTVLKVIPRVTRRAEITEEEEGEKDNGVGCGVVAPSDGSETRRRTVTTTTKNQQQQQLQK